MNLSRKMFNCECCNVVIIQDNGAKRPMSKNAALEEKRRHLEESQSSETISTNESLTKSPSRQANSEQKD